MRSWQWVRHYAGRNCDTTQQKRCFRIIITLVRCSSQQYIQLINPSSSSTSTTSAPPPTSTVTQNPSSGGLTSGAKAGIGVGIALEVGIALGVSIALGVVAAFLVCGYFIFRKSRRNKGLEGSQKVNEMYQPLPPGELQSNPVYAEMDQSQYAVPKRPGVGTMSTPAQLE